MRGLRFFREGIEFFREGLRFIRGGGGVEKLLRGIAKVHGWLRNVQGGEKFSRWL